MAPEERREAIIAATLPLLLAVQRTKGTEDLFWDRVITKGDRKPEDFDRWVTPAEMIRPGMTLEGGG